MINEGFRRVILLDVRSILSFVLQLLHSAFLTSQIVLRDLFSAIHKYIYYTDGDKIVLRYPSTWSKTALIRSCVGQCEEQEWTSYL